MKIRSQWRAALVTLVALVALAACQSAFAQDDLSHIMSGVVKKVDKTTKTIVVKTADGTEQTVKYTGKTSWEGTKAAGEGIKEGSQVTVNYTEKAGEKTATGVKAASKGVADAVK